MEFNRNISIGPYTISNDSPVFIIAEAGVNHGGDIEMAKQLVDAAAEAGVNAVKFQAFRTEHLILEDVDKAIYQKGTTAAQESQYEMLKKLELREEHYAELKNYCESKGLVFLITPFDELSLTEICDLNVAAIKVASTDTTNLPFLNKIAKAGVPIIFSTGMSYLEEIELALAEIYPINKDVVLLQCTANYPIKDDEVNLRVLDTFRREFDILLGYSDHSTGTGAAPYSLALGATVVEKHFTLDKGLPGPDHLASLDPQELKEFVSIVRKVEAYLGSTVKEPTESELGTRKSLQKNLVAARKIEKGELFSEDCLIAKRTGGRGVSPLRYKELLGEEADQSYSKDDIIEWKIK